MKTNVPIELTDDQRSRLAHAYRQRRDHQRSLAADGAYMLTTYASGRTERTFGSAPYGEHALSAFRAARAWICWTDQQAHP